MTNNQPSDTTLRDVYRALLRHRGKALLFFFATMTVTVLATILTPRAYLSESKLFVRLGRENVTLDPTVTLGNDPVVITPYAREDEMNSMAEMLSSRAMLERVVDSVGPEAVLEIGSPDSDSRPLVQQASTMPAPQTSGSPAERAMAYATGMARQALYVDELSVRERAIRHMAGQLKVQPVRKSYIVGLAYEAATPELAQRIVAELVEAYLEEHARLNRVPGSHRFFVEQAERLRGELGDLENELASLKMQTGLASPDDQRVQMITRAGRLEDELLEAESARAEVDAKVRAIRKKLADLPEERVAETTEGINDSGTDGIRQQFFALQLQEKQAAAIYTESHPRLMAIREELAAAKEVHDREERTRVEVKRAPDSIYEQTRLALAAEEPLLESLTAKTGALQRQLAEARGQIETLSAEELRIARLTREIELREADYRKYAVNLEQARIDDALESQRMSNISVMQPASFEARPVRPRTVLNLAIGTLIGLFGAFGMALFAEYADHSFRTPEDIECNLELPALVAIPRMRRKAVKTNGRN
ncbi:MAG: GNVR domain-containing protein [Thermoguttaceae bacterium]|jgi:uncharacterized protein involved in exopolysaccharide biosynthesis|nr:GNVR domain-containing protein [Thermoguttaceae bacterium]